MPKMKATPHINPQDPIAKTILLPGDPFRAEFIAETYLEDAQQSNSVRSILGLTGYYRGTQVSVMGSGMSIPSISFYAWGLIHAHGCEKLIRIGACDSLQPKVNVFDVVIAQAACLSSDFINQYNLPGTYAPIDSFRLIEAVCERAKTNDVASHVGNILSSDTFYNTDPSFSDRWAEAGITAVEMETAGLYATAADVGIEAFGIFIVSGSLITGEVTTTEQRQTAFTDTMKLALPLAQTWSPARSHSNSQEYHSMKKSEIAQMIDHTPLKPEANRIGIARIVKEGAELGTYSVCISPSMFPLEVPEGLHVACVVGFPSDTVRPEVKTARAARAIENDTGKVDMVIGLALVKEGRAKELETEIKATRGTVPAPKILKVIIESAAPNDEKIIVAHKASEAVDADFVKASIGFHPIGGTSVHAVRLMCETVGDRLGVEASGGIHDGKTALEMIEAGASRLGVSASLAILADIEK